MHQAIEAYRANYWDFGPTLASEKLQEREGLVLSRETLRRALIAEGLWMPTRRKRAYHARRPPRSRFGELLQFDGSHHRWFEDRGDRCCLINMVADATGTALSFLTEQETTAAAMKLLWAWIERYGIPQAVYCDKKNAYVPLITDIDLNDYLCYQEARKVSRDYIIQYGRALYTVPECVLPRPRPGDSVTVREWLDGWIHFYYKDKPLLVEEYIIKSKQNKESEHLSA